MNNTTETTLRLENQWREFTSLTNQLLVRSVHDKDMQSRYTELLSHCRTDRSYGASEYPTTVLGMFRAPASKDRHHAFEGGLVAHMLEMWDVWMHWRTAIYTPLAFDDATVWRAILHHDLGKVRKYRLIDRDEHYNPVDEWKVDYAKPSEDRLNHLLGDTHKALSILSRHGIYLTPMLHNALITSHGGYTEDYPRCETAFAKLIYLLDEYSANVLNRLNGRFWDSKIGGIDGTEEA